MIKIEQTIIYITLQLFVIVTATCTLLGIDINVVVMIYLPTYFHKYLYTFVAVTKFACFTYQQG